MLEHDLEIADKARFQCIECNDEIDHFTQGTQWKSYEGESVLLLTMRCRLCWNELDIPARKLSTGKLTQLIVSR